MPDLTISLSVPAAIRQYGLANAEATRLAQSYVHLLEIGADAESRATVKAAANEAAQTTRAFGEALGYYDQPEEPVPAVVQGAWTENELRAGWGDR